MAKLFLNGRWIEVDESDSLYKALRKAYFYAGSDFDRSMHNKYVNGSWRDRVSNKEPLPKTRPGLSAYDYSFTVNVDEETARRFQQSWVGTDINEAGLDKDLEPAFEYKGQQWYAHEGWDVYSRGEIAGSQLGIGKGSQLNTHIYELLPFQMIPAC